MKKEIPLYRDKAKKGGLSGSQRWTAHRLEGKVANRAIKMIRKKKADK